MKYTRELGRKLLELLPEDVKAVACDKCGAVNFYFKVPTKTSCIWNASSGGNSNFAGCTAAMYDCDDWENSLVVRGEKEKWVPKEGDDYLIPTPQSPDFYVRTFHMNREIDRHCIERGLAFRTPEEAIACAKKMLEAVGGGE